MHNTYEYYQVNIIKIMSMFRSSILRLMPQQLYERVDKWTHEPGPILIIIKHLSNASKCHLKFIIN
jgi:hypothetical protein